MRATPCSACLALCIWLLMAPAPVPARAQEIPEAERWASDALGDVAFLSVNAVVGGLTAGLWQELSGGSFAEGLAGGLLGGSVVYAGKRVAAGSFPGAGFLGRDLAATGSSVVRNAAEARPLLDSLSLPVGPFRLYVSPRELKAPRVEVELSDLYWTAYGLAESRLELDLSESRWSSRSRASTTCTGKRPRSGSGGLCESRRPEGPTGSSPPAATVRCRTPSASRRTR